MTSVGDKKKYKQSISLSTYHCSNYTKQKVVSAENIALTVDIPLEILKDWATIKLRVDAPPYVELLNDLIPNKAVKVKGERIENRLRIICAEVKNKFRGKMALPTEN